MRFLPISEINSSDSTVGMYLHSSGFDIICPISSSRKITQIELNLIPSTRKPDGHGCAKRPNACCALKIAHAESSMHILIIQYLFNRSLP